MEKCEKCQEAPDFHLKDKLENQTLMSEEDTAEHSEDTSQHRGGFLLTRRHLQ